jgi:hypothetical protein
MLSWDVEKTAHSCVSFDTIFLKLLLIITIIYLGRTGVHTVADVFCLGCNERIGWFYHKAVDQNQKYKEGMYLLLQRNVHFQTFIREVPSGEGEIGERELVDFKRSCTEHLIYI